MGKITRLSGDQRDNLAAYLDGELEDAAVQDIEQVLSVSEVARHDVDMLSRTWDLLNVLPGAKASEEFTQKTLTTIRAAEAPKTMSQGAKAAMRNVRRGSILAAWTAALVACAYAGFLATNRWVPNESEKLLDDYDIIVNLDQYQEIGSVEFLQALKANRTLTETHNDSTPR